MSTSGGINFLCSEQEAKKIEKNIYRLDKKTNASGLGVACTPTLWKNRHRYYLTAQTHWSIANAREFISEAIKFIKEFKAGDVQEYLSY